MSVWAVDGEAIDAATMIDGVRGNLKHLALQPPRGCAAWTVNGRRTTDATDYDDPLSYVWRGPFHQIRAGFGGTVRDIGLRVNAYMDAGTATLRATASSTWGIGRGTEQSIDSAAGEVVSVTATAPTEVTLLLPITYRLTIFGGSDDDRGTAEYMATYLRLQAIVNAAPNIMTLVSCTPYEVDPT